MRETIDIAAAPTPIASLGRRDNGSTDRVFAHLAQIIAAAAETALT